MSDARASKEFCHVRFILDVFNRDSAKQNVHFHLTLQVAINLVLLSVLRTHLKLETMYLYFKKQFRSQMLWGDTNNYLHFLVFKQN